MRVFIIGTGAMGGAIAQTLAKKGQKVFVYDVNAGKALALKKFGVLFDSGLKQLQTADAVILAVKPFHLADLKVNLKPSAILVSIAAGVKIGKLQKLFGHKKVVRVMPNLGLLAGQGIAAWKAEGLSTTDRSTARKLLDKITENFEVKDEREIDAVTAISGSGPAYFFLLAWSLEQAAQNLGFNSKQARLLVEKTFAGATALQKNESYKDLVLKVMSKKGTTEAAFGVFKKKNFHKIVEAAVQAAFKRAKEISRE